MNVTDYTTPDPTNPPLVQVRVDGEWWPGYIRAQERRDGNWYITVTYTHHNNHTTIGGFWAEDVRADHTDWSHGRS